MNDLLRENLLIGWNINGGYARQLVGGLSADQMTAMPGEGINHPAWVLSHLNAYHPVLLALLTGGTPDDPKEHQFGMQSSPVADASVYAPKEELIETFERGHAEIAAALEQADEATLTRPMPVERWREKFPRAGSPLGYLMLGHESHHLGQISAWRRAMGLGRV